MLTFSSESNEWNNPKKLAVFVFPSPTPCHATSRPNTVTLNPFYAALSALLIRTFIYRAPTDSRHAKTLAGLQYLTDHKTGSIAGLNRKCKTIS